MILQPDRHLGRTQRDLLLAWREHMITAQADASLWLEKADLLAATRARHGIATTNPVLIAHVRMGDLLSDRS